MVAKYVHLLLFQGTISVINDVQYDQVYISGSKMSISHRKVLVQIEIL